MNKAKTIARLLPALVVLSGCQALVVLFEPDPVAKAEFKLTQAPLLIIVEEYAGVPGNLAVRNQVARDLHESLRAHKVNTQIIADRTLWDFQRSHPMSAAWDEARLGKALGAEQVLHVQMEPYTAGSLSADLTEQARMSAHVRVIRAEDGDQLWPLEGKGRMVRFSPQVKDLHGLEPGPDLTRDLAKGLADQIAKLFYRHTMTDAERFRKQTEESAQP